MTTARSPYAVQPHRYCPGCLAKGFHYRQDDPRHYELHVPRSRWPENMRPAHKERVVVDGLVYNKGSEPSAVSEYGTVIANGVDVTATLRMGLEQPDGSRVGVVTIPDPMAVSGDATASVSGDFPNEQTAESPSASETATLAELMRGVPAQTDDTETPEEIAQVVPHAYANAEQSDNPLQCPMCPKVSKSLTGAKSHARAHQRSLTDG